MAYNQITSCQKLPKLQPRTLLIPPPFDCSKTYFSCQLPKHFRLPGITRECAVLDDASVIALGLLRVLEISKTSRDFIQNHGIPTVPGLTRSNYFEGLASQRRLEMFIVLERELQC